MKKIISLALCIFLIFTSGCSLFPDKLPSSLGRYREKLFYCDRSIQDSLEYAKYFYSDADPEGSEFFEKLSSEAKEQLLTHLESFSEWVEAERSSDPDSEVAAAYDFDISVVSEDDYVYIYDDPDYPELGSYDIYFFDAGSLTLYYFHVNI